MAAQRQLFEANPQRDASGLVPASRRTDPITSKIAAQKKTESAASDRALIMAELRRNDGQTAGEIAAHLGWDNHNEKVSRRMTELEKQNLVKRGEKRACSIKGSDMLVWHLK